VVITQRGMDEDEEKAHKEKMKELFVDDDIE
jgi:hypothetical protein